jgi:hypothetical protein
MIIVDTPVEPPKAFEAPEPPVGETMAHPVEMRPFTDAEWQMLRNVVTAANRPLSFAQIHDLLREARNNASIFRTNEELRSLIKQAINAGILLRSGKGARVVYHLAPQEMPEGTDGAVAEAPFAPPEEAHAAAFEPAVEASVVMDAAPAIEAESPEIAAPEAPALDSAAAASIIVGTPEGMAPEAAEPAVEMEAFAPAPEAGHDATIGDIEVPAIIAEGPAVVEEAPVYVGVSSEMAVDEGAPADATVADQPKPRRRRTVSRTTADEDETTAEARPKRSRSKAAAASTGEAPHQTRRRKKVEATDTETIGEPSET